MSECTCAGPWGIGLPFDHPIWKSIIDSCPVHGEAYGGGCACGCKCGRGFGVTTTGTDVTFTHPFGGEVTFTPDWEES